MDDSKLDYQMKELSLNINNFDEPATLTGADAWVKMIITLIYMDKGTYPESPEMGVGIMDYDFEFIDDIIDELEDSINDQINTYLPDIPFESAGVEEYELPSGETILLININLSPSDGDEETAVVAIDTTSKLLNFAVSM